jgi:hypothetical protein
MVDRDAWQVTDRGRGGLAASAEGGRTGGALVRMSPFLLFLASPIGPPSAYHPAPDRRPGGS